MLPRSMFPTEIGVTAATATATATATDSDGHIESAMLWQAGKALGNLLW